MRTKHIIIPLVYRSLRLLLIAVGAMTITACTWTDVLQGSELDPIETIEITSAPPRIVTPRPQTIGEDEDLAGQWVGQAFVDDGTELYYKLELNQDGTEIRGVAYASDEDGAASVDVRGTYEDGLLQLEESGGNLSGDWEAICYWKLDLRATTRSSRMRLTGTFEGIPNSENDCIHSGEISLSRP
jgi:hypothetical protein